MPRGVSPDSVWTEERVQSLKDWWNEGVSGGEIANRLNCSISRNAVIGKVHRLGLPPRSTKKNTHYKRKNTRRKRVFWVPAKTAEVPMPKVEKLAPEPVGGHGLTLLQLTVGTCKYPLGEKSPAKFFCGVATPEGSSFCEYHRGICYYTQKKAAA